MIYWKTGSRYKNSCACFTPIELRPISRQEESDIRELRNREKHASLKLLLLYKGLNTLPCPASSHRLTYSCSSSRQIMAELACFHFWKSLIMARKLARPASFFLVEWSVRPVVSHTRSASNWDSSPSLLFDPKFMDYPRGAPTSSQQGHLTPPCYHHHWQRTHERTHASRLTPEKNLPGRGSQAFFYPDALLDDE